MTLHDTDVREPFPSEEVLDAIDPLRRPGFDPGDAKIASNEAKHGTKRTIEMARMIEAYTRTLQTKQ